jgi:hypothetical protein
MVALSYRHSDQISRWAHADTGSEHFPSCIVFLSHFASQRQGTAESTMQGFVAGLLAGAAMMAATTLIASPAVFGFGTGVQQTSFRSAAVQGVDRTHKGDRLDATDRVQGVQPPARKPEQILAGCEPAISPLSVSARAGNFPRRCVS